MANNVSSNIIGGVTSADGADVTLGSKSDVAVVINTPLVGATDGAYSVILA